MERSDTTALSSYVLVNDTLLVNESSPTAENGALYQSSAGNTFLKAPQSLDCGAFSLQYQAFRVFELLHFVFSFALMPH